MCEPIDFEPGDVSICRRMFSDGFKITGTPETSAKKASKIRESQIMAMVKSTSSELGDSSVSKNQNLDCTAVTCSPKTENLTPLKQSVYRGCTMKLSSPLEECDTNGQGSDYSDYSVENSRQWKRRSFNFMESRNHGVAPRRLSFDLHSPANSPQQTSLFRNLSSGYERMESGLLEQLYMESPGDEVPQSLSSPMSSFAEQSMDIDFNQPCRGSLQASFTLSTTSCARSCLFRSPNDQSSVGPLSFKRPVPPDELSPPPIKRPRNCASLFDGWTLTSTAPEPASLPPQLLQRNHFETEAQAYIMSALNRSTIAADLTGDFSKPCILPLVNGRYEDLKFISSETLSRLIHGDFADSVSDFTIVDCRYPYEYEVGHIDGALNLYTKDMIEQRLLEPLQFTPVSIEPHSMKRSILVFYCDFSLERGPNLSRFLRNLDRQKNKEHYPALHYPEIYLLHGGYKEFLGLKEELCKPHGYLPMCHPDHELDLRQFRRKTEIWQGEKLTRVNAVTSRAKLCF